MTGKRKLSLMAALAGALFISGCGSTTAVGPADDIADPTGAWPIDLSRTYGVASDTTAEVSGDWSNPAFNSPSYERNHGNEKVGAVPPPDYAADMWVDPETGCSYSRTGRPSEVSWTLILNPPGRPLANPICQKYFVSVPYSGPDKWEYLGNNRWRSLSQQT